MPKVVSDEDERLPASYTNFYIGNQKVLVPVFDHKNDAEALVDSAGFVSNTKSCWHSMCGFGLWVWHNSLHQPTATLPCLSVKHNC